MIEEILSNSINKALNSLGFSTPQFIIEHPDNLDHGDYSTNVALALSKEVGAPSKEIAEKIVSLLNSYALEDVTTISIAGPGFINFSLSSNYFVHKLKDLLSDPKQIGSANYLNGQKIIVEYTDPNPIKEFHIGHLMSNTIGEAISRIIEAGGAEVKRACYQGDIGLHVAKAVAYKLKNDEPWDSVDQVAHSYASGSKLYETDASFKEYVVSINKKIYEETDEEVNTAYQEGKRKTLDYFEVIYKKLGTKFDFYFFESTTGEFGKALVHKHPEIFENSEGAIVFRGEKRDPSLHTRVFINKEGLPTYEAKELGLAKIKYDTYPYDSSIVITGNEINDYFRVLLRAMMEIFPHLAQKTKHLSHGMLRLPTGKMSSRTGDVITAEWLINEVKNKVLEKIETSKREISNRDELAESVAIGAIKYSILKQAPGRDIIFDFDKSLSFEGDSGPYLQYTYARTQSLIEKAHDLNIDGGIYSDLPVSTLEKLLIRFPEIVSRSREEYAPHYIVTYLTEIAGLFNRLYAEQQIIDESDDQTSHRVALTKIVGLVLGSGLSLLGIVAPSRM